QPEVVEPSGNGAQPAIEIPRARGASVRTATRGSRAAERGAELELLAESEVADDRDTIQPGDRVFLIVEDDPNFARILLDVAREKDFKGIVGLRGDTGLALARGFRPDAITLDIDLPVIGGWALFDQLKHDPQTRHIPIHIVSVADER